MNDLNVILQSDFYSPGQKLEGEVSWSEVSDGSQSVSIRLIWFTEGKGDRDYKTIDSIEVPVSESSTGATFEFLVPHRPLSFSGKLIALKWAVEAVAKPSNRSALAEFTLSRDSNGIALLDKSDQLKEFGIRKSFISMTRHQ